MKVAVKNKSEVEVVDELMHGSNRLSPYNYTGTNDPFYEPYTFYNTLCNNENTYYVYDHSSGILTASLGNTRITYTPTVMPDGLHYTLNGVYDYYPYGKILREYVQGTQEKYLTTHHQRDEETGLDYRGARFYDCDIARFLSLDPLAAQFASWSAYNYVLGNPLMFIDPDGQSADDYQLKEDGSIDLVKKTDDKTDKIYASKSNGEVDKNKSLEVSKEFMASKETVVEYGGSVGEVYSVKNDMKQGSEIFRFLADNSNVEWGASFGTFNSNSNSLCIIQTNKDPISVGHGGLVKHMSDFTLFTEMHSHPGTSEGAKVPSGYYSDTRQVYSPMLFGDAAYTAGIERLWPNAQSVLYHKPSQTYMRYNSKQILK